MTIHGHYQRKHTYVFPDTTPVSACMCSLVSQRTSVIMKMRRSWRRGSKQVHRLASRGQAERDSTATSRVVDPIRKSDVCVGAQDLREAFSTLQHARRKRKKSDIICPGERAVMKSDAEMPLQENIILGTVHSTLIHVKRQNVKTRFTE